MILRLVDENLDVIARGKIKCKSARDFFRGQEDFIKEVTGEEPNYKINTLTTIDNVMSSYKEKGSGTRYTGPMSMTISPDKEEAAEIVWDHAIDEEGNPVYVGVDLYDEGFVLSTGRNFTNFLGGNIAGYVVSIRNSRTATRMKTGAKSIARVFATKATLLKYLKEHRMNLSYFGDQNGYEYSVQFANPIFEEEYIGKKRTENSRAKEKLLDEEINALLREINDFEEPEPETTFGSTAIEEAERRMRELNIMPTVIQKFIRSNTLLCSETGGIMYDLDDEAKKAVEDTRVYGLPYHVIKNGEMYTVLFVSNEKEDWPTEVWDKKSELAYGNVWNSGFQMAEMGSIIIRPASGGVVRIG